MRLDDISRAHQLQLERDQLQCRLDSIRSAQSMMVKWGSGFDAPHEAWTDTLLIQTCASNNAAAAHCVQQAIIAYYTGLLDLNKQMLEKLGVVVP